MIFNLNAEPRKTTRKSDLTTLRAAGLIPAVIYGPQMESVSVSLSKSDFAQLYKKSFSEVSFWEIAAGGKTYHTILKDKQVHPVTRNFLHLDFMVVEKSAMIELEVPIRYLGEAKGTQEGGMLDILHRSIKIACKADAIPEDLELNVSGLDVNESLHVKDLPKGSWIVKEHDDVALVVVHPKKREEAAPEQPKAESNEEK